VAAAEPRRRSMPAPVSQSPPSPCILLHSSLYVFLCLPPMTMTDPITLYSLPALGQHLEIKNATAMLFSARDKLRNCFWHLLILSVVMSRVGAGTMIPSFLLGSEGKISILIPSLHCHAFYLQTPHLLLFSIISTAIPFEVCAQHNAVARRQSLGPFP
jgi:hypothetical protein